MAECPLLALSGHSQAAAQCPLSGVKRTSSKARYPEISPGGITLTSAAKISCSLRPDSLFRENNSLFLGIGNAGRKPCNDAVT